MQLKENLILYSSKDYILANKESGEHVKIEVLHCISDKDLNIFKASPVPTYGMRLPSKPEYQTTGKTEEEALYACINKISNVNQELLFSLKNKEEAES